VHDAWVRLKQLEQLQQIAALHSDPKDLRSQILRDLRRPGDFSGSPFQRIAARAN